MRQRERIVAVVRHVCWMMPAILYPRKSASTMRPEKPGSIERHRFFSDMHLPFHGVRCATSSKARIDDGGRYRKLAGKIQRRNSISHYGQGCCRGTYQCRMAHRSGPGHVGPHQLTAKGQSEYARRYSISCNPFSLGTFPGNAPPARDSS